MCAHHLCLTDLHVIVYNQKHMLWCVKSRKLVEQNMPFNTPTDHDWSLPQLLHPL